MPTTFAPSLDIGSDRRPPPQPISNNCKFLRGLLFFCNLKCSIKLSLIYLILIGLNLCRGLNFPDGSHHSLAILENFSISFLLIVLVFITLLTLYSRCILSIYFN